MTAGLLAVGTSMAMAQPIHPDLPLVADEAAPGSFAAGVGAPLHPASDSASRPATTTGTNTGTASDSLGDPLPRPGELGTLAVLLTGLAVIGLRSSRLWSRA